MTGIEISSWGQDLKDGSSLIDLLEAVVAAAPERCACGWAVPGAPHRDGGLLPPGRQALPNLCPQFHLSMQSGCDATLKRMNRKYDTARFCESVALLRQYFDRPAITTDLIAGFPGGDGGGICPDAGLPAALRLCRRCTSSPTPSAPAPRRRRCRPGARRR